MTATLTRRSDQVPIPVAVERPVLDTGSAAFRTLIVLIACLLATLPLLGIFEREVWLVDAWITMAAVLGPAALLRLRGPARVWHTWLGLLVAIVWLTARFVHEHALLGLIPTPGTGRDVARLFHQLGDIIRESQVPIAAAAPAVFVLCMVLALFAALVDLLAIVARRAALAGIPMLIIYVVSGAILRTSVHWLLFVAAAAGFLLMLTVNARDEFARWGPLVPRAGETRGRVSLGVSGQRIGVAGIVCALILAAVVPMRAGNSLSTVFGGSGNGSGLFGFPEGGTQIDPFALLKGQLEEPRATELLQVHISSSKPVEPFYLRTNVLNNFSAKGWQEGDEGPSSPLTDGNYYSNPSTDVSALPVETYSAQVKVLNLTGTPAIFGQPQAVRGFGNGAAWLPNLGLIKTDVQQNTAYSELVRQPNPSPQYLAAANNTAGDQLAVRAPRFPATVNQLVASLIASASTQYARARAISDFFTNPANGFVYSLQTKGGDSGSDLVDFLTNRTGFCQQYAGAMAIMLLIAGIPARVVLGYTHQRPQGGTFVVNSTDAHAWVEAFLPGAGWLPFDPTPATNGVGGATTSLAWGPHKDTSTNSAGNQGGNPNPTSTKRAGDVNPQGTASAAPVAAATVAAPNPWPGRIAVTLLLLALVAAFVPVVTRRVRRWRRLRAGRDGDTDALWQELSATAEDLGYVWSAARTPRQVVTWLGDRSDTEVRPLRRLAGAVEAARYAPDGAGSTASGVARPSAESAAHSPADPAAGSTGGTGPQLVDELRAVEAGLRSRRGWPARLRAVVLPQSLGWPLPGSRRAR